MKQYAVVKKLLNLIHDYDNTLSQQVGSGPKETFICVPGQYGPRWIIPANFKIGISVLRQWQPYNCFSKLKWYLLLCSYRLDFLNRIPGVTCLTTNIETNTQELPIIYIGTPGQQQKAVATLVSVKTGKPQRVMKIALGDRAKDSMAQEAFILSTLAQHTTLRTVPVLLDCAKNYEWTIQTVVSGRLTDRKLLNPHINWLLELPKSTKTTTLDEQHIQIKKMIHSCQALGCNNKQKMLQSTIKIQGGTIPLVLVHGDFAPWNLKIQPDNKITAIDWEDAELAGLPLWDLCHFFFIQGHLFNTQSPYKILKKNPLVQLYIKKIGLRQEHILPLVLLYVLQMIVEQDRIVSSQYQKYLMQQVQLIT